MAAGLSGKGLATALGWTPHKVSKLERGRQLIKANEVTAWAEACGRGDDPELIDVLTKLLAAARSTLPTHGQLMAALGMADQQRHYNKLLAEAASVFRFEPDMMPGFVQTEGYAQRILAGVAARHGVEATQLAEAVAVRVARLQMVYEAPAKFTVLIAEPALWWLPYRMPHDIMAGQLERLGSLLDLSELRFGVVPLGAELDAGLPEAFTIYDDERLYVEGWTGDSETNDATQLDQFRKAASWLTKVAVFGDEARALISAALVRHRPT